MSSSLFKAVVAGAVTLGALLLPVTAAQAAGKHHPCGGSGFSDDAFSGDGFGFPLGGGFPFDDDSFPFGGIGFGGNHGWHHHDNNNTTIIVVTADKKHHHKHAAAGNATDDGTATDAGYHQAAPAAAPTRGGYSNNS